MPRRRKSKRGVATPAAPVAAVPPAAPKTRKQAKQAKQRRTQPATQPPKRGPSEAELYYFHALMMAGRTSEAVAFVGQISVKGGVPLVLGSAGREAEEEGDEEPLDADDDTTDHSNGNEDGDASKGSDESDESDDSGHDDPSNDASKTAHTDLNPDDELALYDPWFGITAEELRGAKERSLARERASTDTSADSNDQDSASSSAASVASAVDAADRLSEPALVHDSAESSDSGSDDSDNDSSSAASVASTDAPESESESAADRDSDEDDSDEDVIPQRTAKSIVKDTDKRSATAGKANGRTPRAAVPVSESPVEPMTPVRSRVKLPNAVLASSPPPSSSSSSSPSSASSVSSSSPSPSSNHGQEEDKSKDELIPSPPRSRSRPPPTPYPRKKQRRAMMAAKGTPVGTPVKTPPGLLDSDSDDDDASSSGVVVDGRPLPTVVVEIRSPRWAPISPTLARRHSARIAAMPTGDQQIQAASPAAARKRRRETLATVPAGPHRRLSEADVLRFHNEQFQRALHAAVVAPQSAATSVAAPHSQPIPHTLAAHNPPDPHATTAKKSRKRNRSSSSAKHDSVPVAQVSQEHSTGNRPARTRSSRPPVSAPAKHDTTRGADAEPTDGGPGKSKRASQSAANQKRAERSTRASAAATSALAPVNDGDAADNDPDTSRKRKRPRISESDVFMYHQAHMTPAAGPSAATTGTIDADDNIHNDEDSIDDEGNDSDDDTDNSDFPVNGTRTPNIARYSRTSSASVSDILATSPASDGEFSFLVPSSPTSAMSSVQRRTSNNGGPAPRWQIASPVGPAPRQGR